LAEGVKPMQLPSDFAHMPVATQVFVAINAERADRGLPVFTGMSADLANVAQLGARGARLPPDPGSQYSAADTEWIGAIANGLDADYEWMYDDGPGSGVADCTRSGGTGCWADRHNILDNFGAGTLVMGPAVDPTADTGQDSGGPSLALELAATRNGEGT